VNQKLAVKILEKYGHTVEIAENGSLAVDAFKGRVAQGKPFDIILVGAVLSSVLGWADFLGALDGCVHAVYGRYGGDRVDSVL